MNKNDGGPAFPHDQFVQEVDGQLIEHPAAPGMTLRDWFAGQDSLQEFSSIPLSIGVAVVGPCPQTRFDDDPLPWLEWWALVLARLKYLRADAMLKAREDKP
jgi:hypothetical protein